MKFYGREEEVSLLRKFRDKSRRSAQLVVLTGRRRFGKTALVRRAFDDGKLAYLHLAITRQSEVSLCQELQAEVERVLNLGILGTYSCFADLFRKLMEASLRKVFTHVLDGFQDFDCGKLEEKVAAFFVKHPARRSARRLVKGLSMADM